MLPPPEYIPLPWASVHWLDQCILEFHWNATWWPSVHWDTTRRPWMVHWNTTGKYTHNTGTCSWADSIHASLKWQDGGTPIGKWTGLCIFSFYLEFTALQGIPILLLNMWMLQYYSVHAFDMSTIIVFRYLGLQVKWNLFSSNNSYHTSYIHKGLGSNLT